MKTMLLALAALLVPVAGNAADGAPPPGISLDVLEPGPAFGTSDSEYDRVVRTVFPEAFLPDVRLRMLDSPSMNLAMRMPDGEIVVLGETIVGIKERDGKFVIFASEARAKFWDYTAEGLQSAAHYHLQLDPASASEIRPKRCERAIDAPLAARLIYIWQTMLTQAHTDPNAHGGADGDSYYFSMEVGGRTLAGSTWSPSEGRLAGLTIVADDMESWCMRDRRKWMVNLQHDVADLLTLLDPDHTP